jgi:ABC-2 type transport system permease protein
MELLITSAKPSELMFGKVFGVGLVAFTQMMIIVVTAVIVAIVSFMAYFGNAIDIAGDMQAVTDMMNSGGGATGFESAEGLAAAVGTEGGIGANLSPALVIFFILFFVGGYFVYAFINAAIGCTASRPEDMGAVGTIPNMLAVVGFIVSMVGMFSMGETFVTVLSFIPFFSPFLMFTRIAMGDAGIMDGIIALGIVAATIFLLGLLAARIYRIGVMMYGKPPKIGELLKLAVRS